MGINPGSIVQAQYSDIHMMMLTPMKKICNNSRVSHNIGTHCREIYNVYFSILDFLFQVHPAPAANNESSEVCYIIKPGRRVKLNRSKVVNVHKLLTIRYLPPDELLISTMIAILCVQTTLLS